MIRTLLRRSESLGLQHALATVGGSRLQRIGAGGELADREVAVGAGEPDRQALPGVEHQLLSFGE